MKNKIEKLVSKHTIKMFKAKTLDEMAQCENDFTKKLLVAINYTRCSTELKSKECPMCNEEKDCEGHNVCEDCGGRSF